MLFAIWAKEGGPFIQMTHCLSALGGILAPLVTQPFVSKETGNLMNILPSLWQSFMKPVNRNLCDRLSKSSNWSQTMPENLSEQNN